MIGIFAKILEMSIYGSIAILAVLLFRVIFRKCPKKILILFWSIAALRLICPFNIGLPTSLLNAVDEERLLLSVNKTEQAVSYVEPVTEATAMPAEISADTAAGGEAEVTAAAPQEAVIAAPADTQVSPARHYSWSHIVSAVWITVAASLFIFFSVRYMRFSSKARWTSKSFDGSYYTTDIDSPFVVGFVSPKIFVPAKIDDDEKEYILNHEWTHIKNRDGLIKLISYFILCIHWFNPLVWAAFLILCADIEMRVDEQTTDSFDTELLKEYCTSLVKHSEGNKTGTFLENTAFSGLGFGGMETKMRVKNLLKGRHVSRAVKVGSVVLTVTIAFLLSAASLNRADAQKPETSQTPVTEQSETAAYASETEMTDAAESSENIEGSDPSSNGKPSGSLDITESTGEESAPSSMPSAMPMPSMIDPMPYASLPSSASASHETTSGTEQSVPSASASSAATATATPTPTPRNTSTPAPSRRPSATPTPTPTGRPTSTPTPVTAETPANTTTDPRPGYNDPAVNTHLDNFAYEFARSEEYDFRYLNTDRGYMTVDDGVEETIVIRIDNTDYVLPMASNGFTEQVVRTFLMGSNGHVYFYVGQCTYYGHATHVYELRDNMIYYIGSCPKFAVYDISDPNWFEGDLNTGCNYIFMSRLYRIADNGMPYPVNEFYYFDPELTASVAFVNDLTGNIMSGGVILDDTVTIPAGTYVDLVKTNGCTYIDVLYGNSLVRIDWSDEFLETAERGDEYYITTAITDHVQGTRYPWS